MKLSLLWKILLSTSVALTALFALTAWMVQNHVLRAAGETLEEEVQASSRAYQSIWNSRAEQLASVSLLLSTMSDVRAAFTTGDQATIRDTAGELWARISDENAIFLVTDPGGNVIASLGGLPGASIPAVRAAGARFPRQASGFLLRDGRLYQIVITPVYVQATEGSALLNVLVAGFEVDGRVAQRLKQATGGSDFVFTAGDRVVAASEHPSGGDYATLVMPLPDIQGQPVGQLRILRSFEASRRRMAALRRNILLLWLAVLAAGLGLTYLLARRIIGPVKDLDRAATEVARQNYGCRVPIRSEDELGRLARTFNQMCASIQQAREELIRQERISTIGRLSSSIVHDLRNPLAAIYGGAEMLVDTELGPLQVKRLAANIYRASRRIQELLQDLLHVSRGRAGNVETCRLREVAAAAIDSLAATAESQRVGLALDIPDDIELPLERSRMERVFVNLVANALEAMPEGGEIRVAARSQDGNVLIEVDDTGPGIAPEIRSALFQPFVTARKKGGLGLGLALSRQTVLDHGGDMWVDTEAGSGARFRFRLPLAAKPSGVVGLA